MPLIPIGQSALYYEERGEGPAVILAHGVGGNHASWFNQVPLLARSYRTVVFDHRGFGNSTDAEEIGASAFVDDLGVLLDTLGIDRAVLVGQSMGGGTCATYTCRHPERVRALVLADTSAALTAPEAIRPVMAAATEATRDLPQAIRVLGPRIRAEDPERTLLYGQIASFNSYNLKTLKGRQPRYTIEELAATGTPVLFAVGEHDTIVPPAVMAYLHSQVPGSRFVEFEGAGHSAYFELAEAFNASLIAFLADLDRAS